MPNYTYPQLERLALNAGFSASAAPVAAAIAMAESSGNPQATNHNTNGSTDYGLWQINSVHSGQFGTPGARWYDPQYNAQMAHTLWKSQGFRPWSTYNSGAYHQYVNKSSKPASTSTVSAINAQNANWLTDLLGVPGSKGNPIKPPSGLGGGLSGILPQLGQELSQGPGTSNGSGSLSQALQDLLHLDFLKVFTVSFWTRVGLGALGLFVVIVAVIFMAESNKTVQSTTRTIGKAAVVA